MKTVYTRLSLGERESIDRRMWNGESFNSIARRLHRQTSTVSREVWRAVKKKCRSYHATTAHDRAADRARRGRPKKLDTNVRLKAYVEEHLRAQWSPEEIAKRMWREYPHDMSMRVSHETIYQYLYCLPKGDRHTGLLFRPVQSVAAWYQ